MKQILVAGAGKSSTYLIQNLLSHAARQRWTIVVADANIDAAREKIHDHSCGVAVALDILDEQHRRSLVEKSDLVVSLMPPALHIHLAKDCLLFRKNLITSSYISPEMRSLHEEVKNAGLMFMCEMGLDPGIDHMTASQIIHATQRVAGTIRSFRSYCGGLVAPEDDDNPWHYKFSWNPRNIVVAGRDGAKYLENKQIIEEPYDTLFSGKNKVYVEGLGMLAYYSNRDSMGYLDLYEVPDVLTFQRATLRYPDFCRGWNILVNLGLTREDDRLPDGCATYHDWFRHRTGLTDTNVSVEDGLSEKLKLKSNGRIISMLAWLGLWSDEPLPAGKQSSADILLPLLEQRWEMRPEDKDMVVMKHEVIYEHKGRETQLSSTMVLKGEDREYSAMAKTVGLPMAILARFFLTGKIQAPTGVLIPSMPSIYKPVLRELELHGIRFIDDIR